MLNFIDYLNIPAKIAFVIVILLFIMQLIGEILEFKGKVVPEFMKIRKYFKRKKEEKEAAQEAAKTITEIKQFLIDANQLFTEVNTHYSADNIAKRDSWMEWVNGRAVVYDDSIGKVGKISEDLVGVTKALKDCTKMTEEMFVQSSRDRIIDFASKVADVNAPVTKEEFNRIYKVIKKYEDFLKEHDLTNGEVDVAHRIIDEAYAEHMKNHTFVEDVRGYDI